MPWGEGQTGTWSQEQLKNAAIIVQVGRHMGMSTRDIQIGIITAMTESNLKNVNYGDRDSLGLFQQRPSQGWGTAEQVTNPQYAAMRFFKALKGLGDKRYQMGMGQAAQAVQRSAYPERYAERISSMRKIWPTIQGTAGEQLVGMDGKQYPVQDQGMFNPNAVLDPSYVSDMPPSPSEMLGPWDGSNVMGPWGAPTPTALDDGFGTFIGPHTNDSVIKPLSQEMGSYEAGVDGWRKAVVGYARNAVGTPYVWGGTNLSSGVDCSGLIQAIFGRAGIDVPRISYQQANLGKRVGMGGLRPGDLWAWDNSSRNNGADHIALYIGNGMIIEAPRPGSSVRIRKLGKGEGGWGVSLNF